MSEAKLVSVPLAAHFRLLKEQSPQGNSDRVQMQKVPYANVVGSFMYEMICTRPDLVFGVSIVSKFLKNPGLEHWKAVKWMFRYVKGKLNNCLLYGRQEEKSKMLTSFVDADYVADLDRRRSVTGFLFKFRGCLISWKVSLQHVVALSTIEAKYMAVTKAIKNAIWLQEIIAELKLEVSVIEVYCDNQKVIQLAKHQAYQERTKHIDVRLHFIRDVIAERLVRLMKVHTKENVADALPKVVPSDTLKLLVFVAGRQ